MKISDKYIINTSILKQIQNLIQQVLTISVSRGDEISPKIKKAVNIAEDLRTELYSLQINKSHIKNDND